MKNNGIMTIAAIATLLCATACGGSKKSTLAKADFVEVEVPCADKGYSDANHFRATGQGVSLNPATAKDKALLSAKTRLAGLVETTIKAVTEQYTNEIDIADRKEYEQSFEQMVRDVTSRTLVEVAVTCDRNGTNSKGEYVCYTAVEISKEAVYKGVDQGIKKDQKLQLKYDQLKFKEKFDEEMSKLEQER